MRQLAVLCHKFALLMMLFAALLCFHRNALADAASASVSLTVTDMSGAVVPGAHIVIRNTETNQEQTRSSNSSGIATFSYLKPGRYALSVSKQTFAEVLVDNLVLNLGDQKHLQLILKVGSTEEVVTVDGSGPTVNTTDASVSTIIDRKFVENTPLNGRSFQSLILLAPGVVTNSPQSTSALGSSGEFSVNGQRTESNYYSVDGVGANAGVYPAPNGSGPTGSLPVATALGTTQALVSVDALQEFRLETSTYSAEFGRNPGGQFSMVTRSGTNDLHATAFDYFRNNSLDANNWFNNNAGLGKTAEHQNDFGGTIAGPVRMPFIHHGASETFYFFSYEGVRLLQPVAATINQVPDLSMRSVASGLLARALNAFPLPTPGSPNLGNGIGEFISSWSNPNTEDAVSIRADRQLGTNHRLFIRASDTPSSGRSRGTAVNFSTPSNVIATNYSSKSLTIGDSGSLTSQLSNDFRANLSTNSVATKLSLDAFGGASPIDLNQLQGANANSYTSLIVYIGAYQPSITAESLGGGQRQWNVVDSLSWNHRTHSLKFGIDWRRLSPSIREPAQSVNYYFESVPSVATNQLDLANASTRSSFYPLYKNFSLFAQDDWRVHPHFSLSFGLRWDVNPAPGATKGLRPYVVNGLNDFSSLSLAPQGTSLWNTTWYNLAPRLGVAYTIHSDPAHTTVIRSGAGVFYDTGQQLGSYGFNGPGFQTTKYFGKAYGIPAGFPAPPSLSTPILQSPPVAPYSSVYASPHNLQLPYTYQWNLSIYRTRSPEFRSCTMISARSTPMARLVKKQRSPTRPG
jgi:hypothetical protein